MEALKLQNGRQASASYVAFFPMKLRFLNTHTSSFGFSSEIHYRDCHPLEGKMTLWKMKYPLEAVSSTVAVMDALGRARDVAVTSEV